MSDVEKGRAQSNTLALNTKPPSWSHPADKFWSTYLENAEKQDTALSESWKGDTDGILIFTGLFAVVVASFVVETTSTLQPDPNASTDALLAKISSQLSGTFNASDPSPLDSATFTAPPAAVRVNVLFMASLVLALACALSATLAQQWARRYKHAVSQRGPPHVRGPLRMFLLEGLSRFRFVHVLGCVVALLHGSVFLFVGGLIEYFNTMNSTVSTVVLAMAIVSLTVYLILSVAPLFAADCPFDTPLTGVLHLILGACCYLASSITKLLWTCKGVSRPLTSLRKSMKIVVADHGWAHALKQRASQISVGGLQRAMHSTLRNIDEEHELEAFFDSLPGLLDSLHQGSTAVASHLVYDEGILARVLHLIATSRPEVRRVRVCTATIRALTRRVLGPGSPPSSDATLGHSLWRIIDRLGSLLQSTEGPIALHSACTLGAITADLLNSMERRVELGTTSSLAHDDMSAMFAALLGNRTPSGKANPERSPSLGGGLWVAVEGTQLNLRADGHLRALLLLVRRTLPLLGSDTPPADVDVLVEVLERLHPARAASIPLVLELRDELDAIGALCTRQRYGGEGEALRRVHLALLKSAAGFPGVLGSSVAAIRWKEDEDGKCGSYGMPM